MGNYRELKCGSTAISSCWKQVIDQPDQPWTHYYGFDTTPLSPKIWQREKMLCAIHEEFGFKLIGIARIPPWFNYDWHIDTERGCCINMLLSQVKSHTLFAQLSPDDTEQGLHFTELNYEPHKFYAFNSQRPHCVINFEEPRYIFTCEFLQPKEELSYDMLCGWLDVNEPRYEGSSTDCPSPSD